MELGWDTGYGKGAAKQETKKLFKTGVVGGVQEEQSGNIAYVSQGKIDVLQGSQGDQWGQERRERNSAGTKNSRRWRDKGISNP